MLNKGTGDRATRCRVSQAIQLYQELRFEAPEDQG